MKTMISIDWDYFIPEDLSLDFGHVETLFHIRDLWYIRASTPGIIENIKTTGEELTFINYLKEKFNISRDTKLFISESHLKAYDLIETFNIENVYSFDAHSDLGYKGFKNLISSKTIDCGNWLGLALYNNLLKEANIIYSKKTNEEKKYFKDIIKNINVNFLNKKSINNNEKIDIIHICRSGAWCPPSLDHNFEIFIDSFINELNLTIINKELIKRTWNYDLIKKQQEIHTKFLNENFKK